MSGGGVLHRQKATKNWHFQLRQWAFSAKTPPPPPSARNKIVECLMIAVRNEMPPRTNELLGLQ
jgi:hypothetical protein